MMGRQETGREQLLYTFSMEDHVPEDHLLRGVHKFLDLSSFRQHLKPFYSPIGRPSIDPELMIRMLIVGYRRLRTLAWQGAQSEVGAACGARPPTLPERG